jgi:hypothetical protein
MIPIFTKKEAEQILNADGSVEVSFDLGLSMTKVEVKDGFAVIAGQKIPIDDFKKVKEEFFYVVEDSTLKKVAIFSDETNLYYKLLPTTDWPTITLSSVPMHRHIHMSPKRDTETKIKEVYPIKGRVLDTCCGLGYTAIMAAKYANEVVTFERDENVVGLCRLNPFSQELFTNRKIKLTEGSIFEEISKFKSGSFNRIIHDPPTFKVAPELYSDDFYEELYRVMKKGGILYHYAPAPGKTKGKAFYETIIKHLKSATDFKEIEYHEKSSGIRAVK